MKYTQSQNIQTHSRLAVLDADEHLTDIYQILRYWNNCSEDIKRQNIMNRVTEHQKVTQVWKEKREWMMNYSPPKKIIHNV